MKKTLITLLALAGVAAADSTMTPVASVTDYAISKYEVVSFTDETSPWSAMSGQINAAEGFTLQITLTDWTPANGSLLYLSTSASSVTDQYKTSVATLGYSFNGNGIGGWYGAALFNSSGSMGNGSATTYDYTSTDRTELPSHANASTLDEVKLFITGNAGSVTLYEVDYNNELVKVCSTTNVSEGVAQSIVFAGWSSNNLNQNRATLDLVAYNGVLSEAQMAALIPEPTTATLSLLALCGLAARRRRH